MTPIRPTPHAVSECVHSIAAASNELQRTLTGAHTDQGLIRAMSVLRRIEEFSRQARAHVRMLQRRAREEAKQAKESAGSTTSVSQPRPVKGL